jgi:hypothetical protein
MNQAYLPINDVSNIATFHESDDISALFPFKDAALNMRCVASQSYPGENAHHFSF